MATVSSKALCSVCNKERSTYLCDGCSRRFCMRHLQKHQQMLNGQLDIIINEHDQFRQILIEHKQNPSSSFLLKQIDQWEKTSIEKIAITAQQCRDVVTGQMRRATDVVEEKLSQFTSQLRHVREENDLNEIDLRQLTNKLTEMNKELNEPSNVSIEEDSQTLIRKIHVSFSMRKQIKHQRGTRSSPKECKYHKWKRHATTVAGGNGKGQQLNQLSCPYGICVDQNKNILIADSDNDRIVRWEWQTNSGAVIAGGNGSDQLNWPVDIIVDDENHSIIVADSRNRRVIQLTDQSQSNQQILIDNIDCRGLAMDREGFLYVSDQEKHEVKRWKEGETKGAIVAGGNREGNQLNQLNRPTYLFVDDQQSVYVSDFGNHRVMKWGKGAKEGMIVAGGNGDGNRLHHLSSPQGLFVDRWGQIYVADEGNGRVMRWSEGEREGEIVAGGNGTGKGSNQLSVPTGLWFDGEGNLYVADYGNDQIQKFDLILS